MIRAMMRRGAFLAGVVALAAGLAGTAMAIPPDAPEIDPGSMASALTLLSGGLMVVFGRRRKS